MGIVVVVEEFRGHSIAKHFFVVTGRCWGQCLNQVILGVLILEGKI